MTCFRVIVICAFLSLATVASQSQDTGCKKIESEKPAIYIAFEPEEAGFRKKPGLTYLRLTNNTSCSIYIETDNNDYMDTKLYRSESRKLDNGLIQTNYFQRPVDRIEKVVFYDIAQAKSAWRSANYYDNRDIVFEFSLFPKLSIVFSVEAKHTRKPFRLSVPFNYEWEGVVENSAHRVFYIPEMPKGFEELRNETTGGSFLSNL